MSRTAQIPSSTNNPTVYGTPPPFCLAVNRFFDGGAPLSSKSAPTCTPAFVYFVGPHPRAIRLFLWGAQGRDLCGFLPLIVSFVLEPFLYEAPYCCSGHRSPPRSTVLLSVSASSSRLRRCRSLLAEQRVRGLLLHVGEARIETVKSPRQALNIVGVSAGDLDSGRRKFDQIALRHRRATR